MYMYVHLPGLEPAVCCSQGLRVCPGGPPPLPPPRPLLPSDAAVGNPPGLAHHRGSWGNFLQEGAREKLCGYTHCTGCVCVGEREREREREKEFKVP